MDLDVMDTLDSFTELPDGWGWSSESSAISQGVVDEAKALVGMGRKFNLPDPSASPCEDNTVTLEYQVGKCELLIRVDHDRDSSQYLFVKEQTVDGEPIEIEDKLTEGTSKLLFQILRLGL